MTTRVQTIGNARPAEAATESPRHPARPLCTDTLRIRRSFRSITVDMLIFIIPLSIVYAIVSFISDNSHSTQLEPVFFTALVLLNILRIGVFLEFIRRHFNDLYIIDNRRIRQGHGYLSFNFKVSHIKHQDIREVTVEQSILGRLLDFGNLKIGTASTNDYEIEFIGIGAPKKVSQIIMERRRQYRREHAKSES